MTRRTDDYAAGFADAIEKAAQTHEFWGDDTVPARIRALTPDLPPDRPGRQVTEEMVEAAARVLCAGDPDRVYTFKNAPDMVAWRGRADTARAALKAALAVSHDQKGGR